METTLRRKVVIYIGIMALLVFLCCWYLGIFKCTSKEQLFRIMSDSFFIIGGVAIGIGAISFCVKEGAFDGMQRLFTGRRPDEGKKRSWLGILFFCGLGMAAIGILFACL